MRRRTWGTSARRQAARLGLNGTRDFPPASIKAADPVTGDEVILADLHQRRHDGRIIGPTQRAGHLAVIKLDRMVTSARVRDGYRGQQPSRVGMLGVTEHQLTRPDLDDLAEIHYRYAMA